MIDRLLIANRGEIAGRIIRTARRLGIETIAVYSDADRDMPFVGEADEAVAIGPAPARESYLAGEKILAAARDLGASAVHPGYGFLSENAAFALAVEDAGLVWVGAPPACIEAMGSKDKAKRLMRAAGVPVTPGYDGQDQSIERLAAEADAIGYPVMIKAVAGGGGKGIRWVDRHADFAEALASCRRTANAAFGSDVVLIEAGVERPRHVEVQVFGDRFGNIVHLFERDCSLQRRHQKIIEEAPAPGMTADVREAICQAAVTAARAVSYVGAGTIEFIADASEGLRPDRTWFMEMNTRLQVEHPVTETITGQDLVEWQIRVAAGEPLPLSQEALSISGWSMEARLYAENPSNGFLPSVGPLRHLRLPDGVRVDCGVREGGEISPHYDPMIAKIIAHAPTRRSAAARLSAACRRIEVWPVRTNAAFLARALEEPDFVTGRIDTGFVERHGTLVPDTAPPPEVLAIAAHALLPASDGDPWTSLTGLRVNAAPDRSVLVEVDGERYLVDATDPTVAATIAAIDGEHVLFLDGLAWRFGQPRPDSATGDGDPLDDTICSPMPGRVVAVEVTKGDRVTRGRALVVIEAMKMENRMIAPFDGIVADMRVTIGQQVSEGDVLARLERVSRP